LQFSKKGKAKRKFKRKLRKGKNGEYYVKWEGSQLKVALEVFSTDDVNVHTSYWLKAYDQISQVRDANGNWVFETQIKK
jgi:hypothetical protein